VRSAAIIVVLDPPKQSSTVSRGLLLVRIERSTPLVAGTAAGVLRAGLPAIEHRLERLSRYGLVQGE